jgi:hypothetical protein
LFGRSNITVLQPFFSKAKNAKYLGRSEGTPFPFCHLKAVVNYLIAKHQKLQEPMGNANQKDFEILSHASQNGCHQENKKQ